jgi:tetratricopeptide (TPR) repeat protein
MKFGHLIFPAFFFIILIAGAFWILRTADEVSYAGSNQPVYLESTSRQAVTPQSVGTSREKAHQAFNRFADELVVMEVLSSEERENIEQLLILGEAHWGEENWASSYYAFERVIQGLGPLIDEGGLGSEKATELEGRYKEISESITNEIVFVESTYLESIGIANFGYNALEDKDWITAIQSFAKAIDILNLVKAQAAEIVGMKLQEAHNLLEAGDTDAARELFNEVLFAYPDSIDANRGLDLIQSELAKKDFPEALEDEIVVITSQAFAEEEPSLTIPEDFLNELEDSQNPIISLADKHFLKREFKESLSLYIEAYSKDPHDPGLKKGSIVAGTLCAVRKLFDSLIRPTFFLSSDSGRE